VSFYVALSRAKVVKNCLNGDFFDFFDFSDAWDSSLATQNKQDDGV
jgi:hypothetical protein